MSPILDLQQRLQEVGRIRMGAQVPTSGGKRRPSRLPHWRLTSRDQLRLEAVAGVYGGEVKPWAERDGEYEVFTEADQLQVLIIPGQALSQWWELWSGGGCQRRCDGHHEVLSDGPCLCPAEYDERSEQSNKGKACKPTTRLAVLLPQVPGIGHWRLETHSYYAAVELAAANHLIEEATRRGALLPARLRIDQRKKVAGGTTTPYPVPVLDLDVSAGQLLQLGAGAAAGQLLELPPPAPDAAPAALGHTPVPGGATQGVSVAQGLEASQQPAPPKAPRKNAAEPIGAQPDDDLLGEPALGDPLSEDGSAAASAEPAPAAEPPAPPAPEPEPVESQAAQVGGSAGATDDLGAKMANQRQRRLLWATVRDRGMGDNQLRAILREDTQQESTGSIPAAMFEAVLAHIQGAELWPDDKAPEGAAKEGEGSG